MPRARARRRRPIPRSSPSRDCGRTGRLHAALRAASCRSHLRIWLPTGNLGRMADFSLNEDQIQLQKWVHGFAEDVIRPVAHEWDEREEFPWPVVQEAAKIGLYGWEFLLSSFSDNSGLT